MIGFKRNILLIPVFGFFLFPASAQNKYPASDFKIKPVWIDMMDDSAVNYFQAVKAFNTYWENRVRPEGDEKMNEAENVNQQERMERRRYERKLRKMSAAERNEFDRVNYQYKRFINWKHEVKPYVQADGRVLTIRERLDIRNKQEAERMKHRNN